MHSNIYANNFIKTKPFINLIVVYYTTVTQPPYNSNFIKESNDFYGLIYCVEGSGKIKISGEEKILTANQFIISTHQKIDGISSNNNWDFFFFWFDAFDISFTTDVIISSPLLKSDYLLVLETIDLMHFQNVQHQLRANAIFTEMFMRWLNNSSLTYHDNYKYEIENCIKYINNHLDSELPMNELAKQCCVSEKHFRFLFEKYIGISPKKYIINCKLEKAKYLLQIPELSITDIAYNLFFSSPSHLTSSFREKYNITPKEFRKNN